MSLLRSFVLMECAVSIVDTSSDHSTSTVKWTRTPPISRWPATALTISSHPRIESTISGTVPNGFRPSAAMITRKNTSRLVSPTPVDSHRGVLRRAQGVRQEDSRIIQDRVVWRRVYWVVLENLLLFRFN